MGNIVTIDELKSKKKQKIEKIERAQHDTFMETLRDFVELQESRMELAHIIASNAGYTVLDNEEMELSQEIFKDFSKEVESGILTYEDLLLSFLLTINPKSVMVHNLEKFNNTELIRNISSVFSGSKICDSCTLCEEK